MPDPRLPEAPFALVAEAELEVPAGRYEIHLKGARPARVLIDGEPVSELTDDIANYDAIAKLNADGKPLLLRVELLQMAPREDLRFWLRPIEVPRPESDAL